MKMKSNFAIKTLNLTCENIKIQNNIFTKSYTANWSEKVCVTEKVKK